MYTSIIFSVSKKDAIIIELVESVRSFSGEESFLKVLTYGIIPFLFIVVTTLVITLLINHYINLDILKRKESVIEATDSILTQLLFWNEGFEQMKFAVEEFKFGVPYKKKWCRKLIMERILMMKQNFQLDSNTLLNIYKLFEFEKITYNLLRHRKWHKRSLGIYQLQFMHDVSKQKQLNLLLKEKNLQVKSNALITLVTFSPERFGILANYKEPLNKADEIKLMDIIYHSAPEMPKNTAKLLKSKNTSIVVLGIKLMVLYNTRLTMTQVNKLIRLSNFRIRKEAIKAVGKLKLTEANDILISQYRIEQHKKVKISILVSLKNMGDKEAEEFLKSLLKNETDADIMFKVVDAILTLDPNFFEEKINSSILQNEEIQSMVLHVKDPLLV